MTLSLTLLMLLLVLLLLLVLVLLVVGGGGWLGLALLAAGRQVGRQGSMDVIVGEVQSLVEEGHVVLVLQVTES